LTVAGKRGLAHWLGRHDRRRPGGAFARSSPRPWSKPARWIAALGVIRG
jgi:hypothetical protein